MRSVPALENRKDDPSMSMLSSAVQRSTLGLHSLEQYEPLIGAAAIERIAAKADRVRTMRVAHISSTFYGGGVTELLTPLTLMMNATGIDTDWHLIQGTPGFYAAGRAPGVFGSRKDDLRTGCVRERHAASS